MRNKFSTQNAVEGLVFSLTLTLLATGCNSHSQFRYIVGPKGADGSPGVTLQGPAGQDGTPGGSCHVVDTDGGAEITCDDGSSAFISDGEVIIVEATPTPTPTPQPCRHPDPQPGHGRDPSCHD